MSKPWVGFIAVGFLFLAGVFEWAGGHPKLGVFLMILSVVSLILRVLILHKLGDKDNPK